MSSKEAPALFHSFELAQRHRDLESRLVFLKSRPNWHSDPVIRKMIAEVKAEKAALYNPRPTNTGHE
jgi:hypothetical protein